MDRSEDFRAGQRVRIRPYADSEFAGYEGTVVYVGGKVCDVKIRHRPQGSKASSTYIGTFQKQDLESLKRGMDLANYAVHRQQSAFSSLIWTTTLLITALVVAGLLLWMGV